MLQLRTALRIGMAALSSFCATSAVAGSLTGASVAPTTRQAPEEFGTVDYTVTTIPAAAFTYQSNDGYSNGQCACTSYQCGCFNGATAWSFYAGVNLPSGAVIDYVGLQSYSPNIYQTGVALYLNGRYGTQDTLITYSSSAHGWDTDYNAVPLGFQLPANVHNALVAHVELANASDLAYFAWVEIWWHRTVSPAPSTATFADVPVDHPFFQFIEAIAAAGITVGCGNGNFCPDQPITRKQEAAFIAKALGLHWPY
jgi:hypothetical protein